MNKFVCTAEVSGEKIYIREHDTGGYDSGLFYAPRQSTFLRRDLEKWAATVPALKSKITKEIGHKLDWQKYDNQSN